MRPTATESGSNQQAVQHCFMLSPSGCSALPGQCWVTQSIQAAIHSALQLEPPVHGVLDLSIEELVEGSNQILWWTLLDDAAHFVSKTY